MLCERVLIIIVIPHISVILYNLAWTSPNMLQQKLCDRFMVQQHLLMSHSDTESKDERMKQDERTEQNSKTKNEMA